MSSMNNIIPVILVVHKSKDGFWRGFCYPYDISCNASSQEDAKKQIEEMVETYEEVLKKYNNPIHLIKKELTEEEDRKVFDKLWPVIVKQITEKLKLSRTPASYANGLSKLTTFNHNSSLISFFHKGTPQTV